MRPFCTTGDDHPFPGTSTCQRTFSVLLQWIGKPVALECPWPLGPRNCVQSSAMAHSGPRPTSSASNRSVRDVTILISLGFRIFDGHDFDFQLPLGNIDFSPLADF